MSLRSCSSFLVLALSLLSSATAAAVSSSSSVPQACATALDGVLPSPTPSNFKFSGNVRRYYVAAEEVSWNYAPSGWDNWLGVPLGASPRAQSAGYNQYGYTWQKALYRGYTDATFSTLLTQPAWQGTQGPTLRSEVGDLIEILFVNRLPNQYASMHSMGLAYTKDHEGSLYPNNTTPGQAVAPALGDALAPGQCYVYKWMVSDGAAPPAGQPSQLWGYHSYVSLYEDTNAGLVGPQIVYQRGQMNSTMANYREFPLLYMNYDESASILSTTNMQRLVKSPSGFTSSASSAPSSTSAFSDTRSTDNYGNGHYTARNSVRQANNAQGTATAIATPSALASGTPGFGNYSFWHPQLTNLNAAGGFLFAPNWNTMNGYVYANSPPFEMCLDDKVIWYVYAYGIASHVFHMHGNGFTHNGGMNQASIGINDGEMKTLHMTAVGAGKWQVICHVSNHLSSGMEEFYVVYPNGCPLPALG
ncbi:hypothetical protein LTR66_002819 [Elasticomyces elasticus]|nr:hypothetical protein LTR66_002819 [Elasticomyces elasticus]